MNELFQKNKKIATIKPWNTTKNKYYNRKCNEFFKSQNKNL